MTVINNSNDPALVLVSVKFASNSPYKGFTTLIGAATTVIFQWELAL